MVFVTSNVVCGVIKFQIHCLTKNVFEIVKSNFNFVEILTNKVLNSVENV